VTQGGSMRNLSSVFSAFALLLTAAATQAQQANLRSVLRVDSVGGDTGYASWSTARSTRIEIDSDHSTMRLFVSSSKQPDGGINVGVARMNGVVLWKLNDPAQALVEFTAYPADQNGPGVHPGDKEPGPGVPKTENYAVIGFKSKHVVPMGGGAPGRCPRRHWRFDGNASPTKRRRTRRIRGAGSAQVLNTINLSQTKAEVKSDPNR